MKQLHTFRVRNLSGKFDKTFQAFSSFDACVRAVKEHGAHPRSKFYAVMVSENRARDK